MQIVILCKLWVMAAKQLPKHAEEVFHFILLTYLVLQLVRFCTSVDTHGPAGRHVKRTVEVPHVVTSKQKWLDKFTKILQHQISNNLFIPFPAASCTDGRTDSTFTTRSAGIRTRPKKIMKPNSVFLRYIRVKFSVYVGLYRHVGLVHGAKIPRSLKFDTACKSLNLDSGLAPKAVKE